MPDRADYLANALLRRRRALETSLAEDAPAQRADGDAAREQMVAKVLAVEADTTDSATIRGVLSALPHYSPLRSETDRERAEFADYLRVRLKL